MQSSLPSPQTHSPARRAAAPARRPFVRGMLAGAAAGIVVAGGVHLFWPGLNARLAPPPSTPSSVPSGVPSGASQPTADATNPTAGSTPTLRGPTQHAHPLAGGPVPAGAREVTAVIHPGEGISVGILKTPTGNIGCDISIRAAEGTTELDCSVSSWQDAPPVPPVDTDDGLPWIRFGDGSQPPTFGGSRGDGFCFMDDYCEAATGGQVVDYGEMVYYGEWVCASEQNGLTCWNARTRHGAFMSRSYFEPF